MNTHTGSSQNTRPDLPTAGRVATSGEGGDTASPLPSPLVTYKVVPCELCTKPFSEEVLTPIFGEGLSCWSCLERLRDSGLDIA